MKRPSRGIVVAGIVLLGALGFAAVRGPARVPRFVLGFAYRGPLVDAGRFEAWAERNPDIFGPLGETARFSIVESPSDSTGLILTKTARGISVRRSHFLLFQRIPVALAMKPAAAEELLRLDQSDVNRFWDGIKFLVQSRSVVVYVFAPRRDLDRVGLTGFLQVIDAIPPKV